MGIPTINFGSNNNDFTKKISGLFNIINPNQLYLDPDIEDKNLLEKDIKTKNNLYKLAKEKNIKIYQAQPYSDNKIQEIYTDSCKKSIELNDKRNLSKWIPQENLLEQRTDPFDEYPYVAKLSRSSAGDATVIISNKIDQNKFIQNFGKYFNKIAPLYEEYCDGPEYALEIAIDYK
jgi:Tfp pilus assembly protein PilP